MHLQQEINPSVPELKAVGDVNSSCSPEDCPRLRDVVGSTFFEHPKEPRKRRLRSHKCEKIRRTWTS